MSKEYFQDNGFGGVELDHAPIEGSFVLESTGNLTQKGRFTKKRSSTRLTDEGRQVAMDNISRWSKELRLEGLEVNSGTLYEKFTSAMVDWDDSQSGQFGNLIRKSIQMRLNNLGRREEKQARLREQIKEENIFRGRRAAFATIGAGIAGIAAAAYIAEKDLKKSTFEKTGNVVAGLLKKDENKQIAKEVVQVTAQPEVTEPVNVPTKIEATEEPKSTPAPIVEAKVQSFVEKYFGLKDTNITITKLIRFPWDERVYEPDLLIQTSHDALTGEVATQFNNWQIHPYATKVTRTEDDGSYLLKIHSGINKGGAPLIGQNALEDNHIGKFVEINTVDSQGKEIVTRYKITGSKVFKMSHEEFDLTYMYKGDQPDCPAYYDKKEMGIHGDLNISMCSGRYINGNYESTTVFTTEFVTQFENRNPDKNLVDTVKYFGNNVKQQVTQQLQDAFNTFVLFQNKIKGRVGDYVDKTWYQPRKNQFSADQQKRIEGEIRFCNERDTPQCIHWQSLTAAVVDTDRPLIIGGVDIGEDLTQLIPENIPNMVSGEWKVLKNKQNLDVAVGDVPLEQINEGDAIVTRYNHIVRIGPIVKTQEGKSLVSVSEANRHNDGSVDSYIVTSLEELKQKINSAQIYLIKRA